MMSSVDGRLLVQRYSNPYDEKGITEIQDLYFSIGAEYHSDADIIGRSTIQEYFFPQTYQVTDTTPIKDFAPYKGNSKNGHYLIVIDSKGKIDYNHENSKTTDIITILGEGVSEEYMEHLRSHGISYLFAGPDGKDLHKALDTLASFFGIKLLMLEGGGCINGTFLKEGLIDELNLLIYPGIDGLSGIPSIFEYKGTENELPALGQSLEFKSAEALDYGVVRVQYQFHKQ